MPRNRTKLTAEKLRQLARTGAEHALNRLRAEIVAIERAFPELKLPKTRRTIRRSMASVSKRARTMSASARAEVSRRMKRYWAERRRAKAKLAK